MDTSKLARDLLIHLKSDRSAADWVNWVNSLLAPFRFGTAERTTSCGDGI